MENKSIVVLPGDGIGPEVIAEAIKVMDAIAERFGHSFSFIQGDIGAVAIAENGVPLPENTLKNCLKYGTVLLGAVGDPSYDNRPDLKIRPEQGLLQLRKAIIRH
jgi:3-isopropylmalate dehydrogenase